MKLTREINELTEEGGKEAVRLSYQYFQEKDYVNTLKILEPILKDNKTIKSKVFTTAFLWSIAGDSLYLLNEIEPAIDAYRKSIELDELTTAIPAYAYVVAKHRITHEACYAYDKLLAYENAQNSNPKQWRFLAFIFGILYMRKTWWLLYIQLPFVKWRLKNIMKNKGPSNQ